LILNIDLNDRIKDWHVMDFWNLDRHDLPFFTQYLASVCGLLNLQIAGGQPIRADLRTLLPRVARVHHDAKVRKRREEAEERKKAEAKGIKRRKKTAEIEVESEPESESGSSVPGSDDESSEAPSQDIEKIVRHRGRTYRVRWLGYSHHQ
jgi:hypothetical protein